MESALDDVLAQRLATCQAAVAEFHDALSTVQRSPQRAAELVAVLHVLEQRAHTSFAELRRTLLQL